ncbi:hypothetical protein METBIDRAFT_33027 [Metschnikowia bicuspidata var. bicuspidata NRRL YB-4993]|uniref:Uncharacterized protein n=1 Tax=Metschnikowia bicuspidata var. bicuspidata NRRL YB-4993 TaxID=869754 RepID=A0A1A0H820_9ASCO|nr:hypothetical protein METBIDRAFT_33027 [Metschnikowia bicuspidata var. bicuspidata NRRL YB-4993]OBA20043.1 hypothetical protein METBIDRAFT_33027 [Metschnikowia bicuspidata var. bicuspidata NRRL YB-4993]
MSYRFIFDIDDFESEVRQWAANRDMSCDENHASRQNLKFDPRVWNGLAWKHSVLAMQLTVVLLVAYMRLFRSVHESIESLYEHRAQSRITECIGEATLGLATSNKKGKKVSFLLPEPRLFSIEYLEKKVHVVGHLILPSKRQIQSAFVCLGLGTFLLPRALHHAFHFHFICAKWLKFTSDNLIASILLFTGFELASIASLKLSSPTSLCNIRVAFSRFIQFYGVFLLLISMLALVQANDTLKLYVYKMLAPCGSANRWSSFFDVRVPNENILSAILGETMMKYTNGKLSENLSPQQAHEVIQGAIDLFARGLGDCVTVLLFATLVFVPGALVHVCGY